MKKKILIGLLLFVVFIIILAPASLIKNLSSKQELVLLRGFSGTLWSGEIASVSARKLSLEDVKYDIKVLPLFWAMFSVDLDISKGDIKGSLTFSADQNFQISHSVNNANIRFDAKLLENFVNTMGAKIGGNVSTSELDITIDKGKPSFLEGVTRWRNASVNFAGQNLSLGDFSVRFMTNEKNGDIKGRLEKGKNILDLQGEVTLAKSGELEFIGSASSQIDKGLLMAVSMYKNGNEANGRIPIKFKQKLFK
ncbi:type II secretion system protein N [Aliikangiella sp. G2MR2-5]|uniref:type II secretion system protein N n=1 Tax=Aliikangiella sp. G2MR2-5 TaxID=2788943 RepID=UPI0018A8F023|nr:type II secretion system protein N [Aliikangiella sp. G2MR2-5]